MPPSNTRALAEVLVPPAALRASGARISPLLALWLNRPRKQGITARFDNGSTSRSVTIGRQPAGADTGLAHLLNQRGNSLFRSGDLAGAERCYRSARTRVSVADPGTASLAVDILKGLGDVAMCLDRREEASEALQGMFSIIADNSLSSFGRTPEAKALQYAGDVARRQAVTSHEPDAEVNGRKAGEARYWYERARELYAAQDLELGSLITGFKSMELCALEGDHATALAGHTEIAGQFAGIGNSYWLFRSAVAILKFSADVGLATATPLITHYRAEAQRSVGDNPSPVDELWKRIVLAMISPNASVRTAAVEECRRFADAAGLHALAGALGHGLPGRWPYTYF